MHWKEGQGSDGKDTPSNPSPRTELGGSAAYKPTGPKSQTHTHTRTPARSDLSILSPPPVDAAERTPTTSRTAETVATPSARISSIGRPRVGAELTGAKSSSVFSITQIGGGCIGHLASISSSFVVYGFRPPAGRGPGGNRPRPEQPQLNPTFQVKVNPAALLLAELVLTKRVDSKAQ